MIVNENYLGCIYITEKYIKEMVSQAVSESVGIAELGCANLREFFLSDILGIKLAGKGVNVEISGNKAAVSVYIAAVYGTNLKAVMRSVKNKIYYALDNAGVPVSSVRVYVSHVNIRK